MSRKLAKFQIIFDNSSLLYFPGQFLSGRVILKLNDETSTLGLHFHVVGESVVQIKNIKQTLHDKENYIDFRMRLLGDSANVPILLSPGIHSFPFKLGLPLGLPSTFIGKHGWIQYFCKAALREASGFIHKSQQVFIVINPVNLNDESPSLQKPFKCDVEHWFRVGCFSSGPVVCVVVLDKGAYVSGETITISALIQNRSKVTIRSTKAILVETVKYTSKNKLIHTESRQLCSVNKGRIRSNEETEWKEEQLYIPPLPPTNLRGCHLISINYDIYFIICPSGIQNDVKLQLPLLIGTYPFGTDEESDDEGSRPSSHYPLTLPIFRPWIDEKTLRN